jgi:hypothetical protein
MTLLHWGWYQHALIRDTAEYHRYGTAMVKGHVPYRDFAVEYPPGALPSFALPAVGEPGFPQYDRQFQLLMALCGVGALAAMALALHALNASVERTAAALAFFALAPLVLGSVILYRYDLWPAVLTVAGLAAVLVRRARLGFAAIGLGFLMVLRNYDSAAGWFAVSTGVVLSVIASFRSPFSIGETSVSSAPGHHPKKKQTPTNPPTGG